MGKGGSHQVPVTLPLLSLDPAGCRQETLPNTPVKNVAHYLSSLSFFPGGSDGKELACNAGDQGLIPGSGRSPGEGNGNPLQYLCPENPMDKVGLRSLGSQRVRRNRAANTFTFIPVLQESSH